MKVLFVTNFCPHYHVKLFEMLSSRMDVVFLFSSRGDPWYWDPRHGVQHGRFQYRYLVEDGGIGQIATTIAFLREMQVSRADVMVSAIFGRLPFLAGYAAARAMRMPYVLWTGLWSHPKTLFHRLSFPLLRQIYLGSNALVAYGSHVRDYLTGIGVSPERVFVANHALDNDMYNVRPPSQELDAMRSQLRLDGRKVVLFVGRLTASKGVEGLIQAIHQLNDLNPVLLVAGEGDLRPRLATQASALGVQAQFIGYVPTQDLYRYYALADAFVLPSVSTDQGKEPWGLVLNEAMNQAVPVIASSAVGAAAGGLVRNNETGLVFPEGDVQALATCLRTILANPALAHSLGHRGLQEIGYWNNDRMADAFVNAANYALFAGGTRG